MVVVAIFGSTVEFNYKDNSELNYMEIDEFVENYGLEALTGELEVEEYQEGQMYKF